MADNIHFNDRAINNQFQRLIKQNKYKSKANEQKQYDDREQNKPQVKSQQSREKTTTDDDQKVFDDQKECNKSVDEYAIITVGASGTGKSSIMQLFCGEMVQTKTVKLYEEIAADCITNRKWMDTQGLDDTNMNSMSEHILKELRLKKIHFMIVIWLISGDFTRQRGEYLRQAKFIKSLENEKSIRNIWQNTLIIRKMGMLQPKMKNILGIIDSAKKYGASDSICDHIAGFKCIDMIKENGDQDSMYEALVDAEVSSEKLMEFGYVTRKQMKGIIHEKLSKLKCFVVD